MAVLLAYRPLQGRVGATMLWCVSGFGVFTIVFGISRNLILSLLALMLGGRERHGKRGDSRNVCFN